MESLCFFFTVANFPGIGTLGDGSKVSTPLSGSLPFEERIPCVTQSLPDQDVGPGVTRDVKR